MPGQDSFLPTKHETFGRPADEFRPRDVIADKGRQPTEFPAHTINTAAQLTDVRIARNANNPERDRTSYENLVKEKRGKNRCSEIILEVRLVSADNHLIKTTEKQRGETVHTCSWLYSYVTH